MVSIILLVLLYFIISKPLTFADNLYFTNNERGYGDVRMVYNQTPEDMNFYRINVVGGKLNVPDSRAYLNKDLYNYDMSVNYSDAVLGSRATELEKYFD
jgi:hypothetical protein